MDLILWLSSNYRLKQACLVSILVLVDLILWRQSFSYNLTTVWSFNPCFGGSHIVTMYNILNIDLGGVFQSLFWWISYCDKNNLLSLSLKAGGFNPCFGGSHIVTFCVSNPIEFDGCFNPCFGGSHIVTETVFYDNEGLKMFQSLFWWISYCDLERHFRNERSYRFQSLFWWISYCDCWSPS